MPTSPQQTYTCDTLPAPQNILPYSPMSRFSPSSYTLHSSEVDSSFLTPFDIDVPTNEEVINATSHSDPVSSMYKSDTDHEFSLPQPPARKLCVRHQRMADEGTIIKLQQVSFWHPATQYSHMRDILCAFESVISFCFSLTNQFVVFGCAPNRR